MNDLDSVLIDLLLSANEKQPADRIEVCLFVLIVFVHLSAVFVSVITFYVSVAMVLQRYPHPLLPYYI